MSEELNKTCMLREYKEEPHLFDAIIADFGQYPENPFLVRIRKDYKGMSTPYRKIFKSAIKLMVSCAKNDNKICSLNPHEGYVWIDFNWALFFLDVLKLTCENPNNSWLLFFDDEKEFLKRETLELRKESDNSVKP